MREKRRQRSVVRPPSADDVDHQVVEAKVGGHSILIDKREDHLIINDDCKKIMRNLCSAPTDRGFNTGEAAAITQPSFLSAEDRVLFFKTKMFYLLQERHCFLQQLGEGSGRRVAPADAYVPFLSPFCDSIFEFEEPDDDTAANKRHSRFTELMRATPEGTMLVASTMKAIYKSRSRTVQNPQRNGLFKFLESVRKADQSTMRKLEEKILKTMEGAGYAVLLGDLKKTDVIMRIFPDYNRLLNDGKDEESRLNNLANHVRTRVKYFDKLQSFFENQHDDHTAHVFTVPNLDHVVVREELIALRPKRLHQMDEKAVQKLYGIFKDDYSAAKTTLIADGTQPVVLNRKKLDRVKKYVDECAEWKGNLLVPYNRETNFFFLMFPWTTKGKRDSAKKGDNDAAAVVRSSFAA